MCALWSQHITMGGVGASCAYLKRLAWILIEQIQFVSKERERNFSWTEKGLLLPGSSPVPHPFSIPAQVHLLAHSPHSDTCCFNSGRGCLVQLKNVAAMASCQELYPFNHHTEFRRALQAEVSWSHPVFCSDLSKQNDPPALPRSMFSHSPNHCSSFVSLQCFLYSSHAILVHFEPRRSCRRPPITPIYSQSRKHHL